MNTERIRVQRHAARTGAIKGACESDALPLLFVNTKRIGVQRHAARSGHQRAAHAAMPAFCKVHFTCAGAKVA